MKIEVNEEKAELNPITLAQEYSCDDKARGLLNLFFGRMARFDRIVRITIKTPPPDRKKSK